MLQPVRVVAIAAVLRPARRLHIGGLPRLGAEGTQGGGGMERARTDFHVVGLKQQAALPGPVGLKREDQILKRRSRGNSGGGPRKEIGRESCMEREGKEEEN